MIVKTVAESAYTLVVLRLLADVCLSDFSKPVSIESGILIGMYLWLGAMYVGLRRI